MPPLQIIKKLYNCTLISKFSGDCRRMVDDVDNYSEFAKAYPVQEMFINGAKFKYRYYNNEQAKETLVLLVGGLGLSDIGYRHFTRFAKNFSVITFDYNTHYKTIHELCKAIASLLQNLDKKVWITGQAFGGFIAQMMAIKHKDLVEGLILSNTGCCPSQANENAHRSLVDMIKKSQKSKRKLSITPAFLFKKKLRKQMHKNASGATGQQKILLDSIFNIVEAQLTKKYELHITNLLIDLKHYFNMDSESFKFLKDRVLLILADDDKTFHNDVRKALIDIMSSPKVITDFKGGHLALVIHCDKYIEVVTEYIKSRETE